MNKSDLIERVAEATGEARSRAGEMVDATLGAVQSALASGERVVIPGFGTFAPRARKARTGRNPQTGASVNIPATTIPVFKAGSALKALVSGKAKLSVTKTSAKKSTSKAKPSGGSKAKPAAKKAASKAKSVKKSASKAKPAAKSAAKKPASKAKSGKSSAKSSKRR